jgi:hypothetical protein
VEKRKESWILLKFLRIFQPDTWLCVGDFNEILEESEKYGLRRTPQHQMRTFRKALESCKLEDLGYVGASFTWNNFRDGRDHTRERLDRALSNNAWRGLFPIHRVEVLPTCTSDHTPLLITFQRQSCRGEVKKKNALVTYEAEWGREKHQKEIIKKVWRVKQRHENEWQGVKKKLKNCQSLFCRGE